MCSATRVYIFHRSVAAGIRSYSKTPNWKMTQLFTYTQILTVQQSTSNKFTMHSNHRYYRSLDYNTYLTPRMVQGCIRSAIVVSTHPWKLIFIWGVQELRNTPLFDIAEVESGNKPRCCAAAGTEVSSCCKRHTGFP